ncbi:MAG: hypothetical protein LBT66_07430 [Methanobrevibacter sp.]|nr:hypothetical protein [Candidatus Methanovirga meridionalis]
MYFVSVWVFWLNSNNPHTYFAFSSEVTFNCMNLSFYFQSPKIVSILCFLLL